MTQDTSGDFMCENTEGCSKAATHKVEHPSFTRASLMCEPHAHDFAESMKRYGYSAVTVTPKAVLA